MGKIKIQCEAIARHSGKRCRCKGYFTPTSRRMLCTYHKASKSWNHRTRKYMGLYQRYNNEDVLMRAVIAGMLDVLNNQIKYNQVWSTDDIETIEIPWYYNQSGDERFMQDFYTHYAHCVPPKPVDGNFDMIPRGILTYTGSTIDEQRITSRFVQGKYVKDIGGGLYECSMCHMNFTRDQVMDQKTEEQ